MARGALFQRNGHSIAVLLHRWVGLGLAGFLFLAGLTGSVIAFHHELDRWINPDVLTVDPSSERLAPKEWIAAAEEAHPGSRVTYVTVPHAADEPVVCYLTPRPNAAANEPDAIQADQVFVDPATAEVLGSRDRDGFHLNRLHLIPFIYTLHYSLHLGQWGMWILGGVALIWFFDCFIGLYLAWPRRAWNAVKRALTVKWGASSSRVNYDLHRAGGLWVWPVLLVLAFSGMSINLHEEVFEPVIEAVAPMSPWPGDGAPERERPETPMSTPVGQALKASRKALANDELEGELGAIWLDYTKGLYHFGYHTSEDFMREHPGTWVSVSDQPGETLEVRPPGGHTTGDLIHDLQFPLHSGKLAGLPGRVLVSMSGLVVAMLSVTGVVIWWKKRRGRVKLQLRREENRGASVQEKETSIAKNGRSERNRLKGRAWTER